MPRVLLMDAFLAAIEPVSSAVVAVLGGGLRRLQDHHQEVVTLIQAQKPPLAVYLDPALLSRALDRDGR